MSPGPWAQGGQQGLSGVSTGVREPGDCSDLRQKGKHLDFELHFNGNEVDEKTVSLPPFQLYLLHHEELLKLEGTSTGRDPRGARCPAPNPSSCTHCAVEQGALAAGRHPSSVCVLVSIEISAAPPQGAG